VGHAGQSTRTRCATTYPARTTSSQHMTAFPFLLITNLPVSLFSLANVPDLHCICPVILTDLYRALGRNLIYKRE
jgi:hypothetical protein